MTKAAAKYCLLFGFMAMCLFLAEPAKAQLRMIPLETTAPAKQKSAGVSFRKQVATDSLRLPFWDDFTFSSSVPDSNLWAASEHVAVTNTIAVAPPSFNVATFDGIDASGRPYSQDAKISGRSDTLTSLPIQLGAGQLSAAEQASVFLSFYWQIQGRGDRPEKGDSLKLFFLADDSTTHQVWSQGAREEVDSADFQQEIISLKEAGDALGVNFFHEGFRFQFASYNRQSGMFDLWHVDYIYLDKGRNRNSLYYHDRSISDVHASLFYPYAAVPIGQYFADPAKYNNPSFNFTTFSLEEPGKQEPVEYSITILEGEEVLFTLADPASSGYTANGQQYNKIEREGLPATALQDYQQRDSLYLTTLISLNSEEPKAFFNFNDTVRVENVLHDYFAYDDGTAEYGVEVRGDRGLRFAYEYELSTKDTLTHIDLYLPYFMQGLGGQFVDLKIWTQLASEGRQDSLLYSMRDVQLQNSSGLNEFTSYELRSPLILKPGTFYIGLEKRSDSFLAIGFDRNTDSRQKVFVSTDQESWNASLEDKGSIMMRPRFKQGVDPNILSAREPEFTYPVRIYPNPSEGLLVVESQARVLEVYSSQGQLLRSFEQRPGASRKEIDLRELPGGLYLIKMIFKDASVSKKILIKN